MAAGGGLELTAGQCFDVRRWATSLHRAADLLDRIVPPGLSGGSVVDVDAAAPISLAARRPEGEAGVVRTRGLQVVPVLPATTEQNEIDRILSASLASLAAAQATFGEHLVSVAAALQVAQRVAKERDYLLTHFPLYPHEHTDLRNCIRQMAQDSGFGSRCRSGGRG